jgi:hypothetical protein
MSTLFPGLKVVSLRKLIFLKMIFFSFWLLLLSVENFETNCSFPQGERRPLYPTARSPLAPRGHVTRGRQRPLADWKTSDAGKWNRGKW